MSSKFVLSLKYFQFDPSIIIEIILPMSNLDGVKRVQDVDESQTLNGYGSLTIFSKQTKKPSKSNSLMSHVKTFRYIYIIIAAIALIALIAANIQKEYESSMSKASAEIDSMKVELDRPNVKSSTSDMGGGLHAGDQSKGQVQSWQKRQALKGKQLVDILDPFTKIPNQQAPKFIYKEQPNEKIVDQNIPKMQNPLQKNKQSLESTKKSQKDVKVKAIIPNKAMMRSKVPSAFFRSNVHSVVAGVTSEQREKAQKWLGLKSQDIFQRSDLADEERKYYQAKYNISSYNELPICIVIPSYNNVKDNRHIKNIKSVVMQEYTNYHIVFIDDASNDGTGEQIQAFLMGQSKLSKQRYVVIKNQEQKRAMPNLRRAAKEFCQPQDIFIIVDGDDQLIGRQVLKLFNTVFQSKKAWFVYSNFLSVRGAVGYSRPFPQAIIKSNKYRSYPFVTSHLRAFYTQLFLNIKQDDLKNDSGNYLKAANDVAICIPILEMSHERVVYLPQLTYYYNSNTGQNNHQLRLQEQKANDRMLRHRKSYPRQNQLDFPPRLSQVQKANVKQNLQMSKNVAVQSFKNLQ